MEKGKINIIPGELKHYDEMLEVFNAGFSSKFRFIVKDETQLKSFSHDFGLVSSSFGEGCFVAVRDNKVLGILNLKYSNKKYSDDDLNMDVRSIVKKYGFIAIVKAIFLGIAFNYSPPKKEVYIDNISVSTDARGQGIGTLLLDYAKEQAKINGCKTISLYVIDENPRAKALYERQGFITKKHKTYKWLKKRTGISGNIFMVLDL